MVFNVPIMAISLSQPNSSHSINETPGLLHSISTQRHTTFGDDRSDLSAHSTHTQTPRDSTSPPPPPDQELSPDSWVPIQTKCSHLTLGFQLRRSAKQFLPTAAAAPQPPGHGNILFYSIISWTLLCILHGSSNTLCTDLTVGVPLAGTPRCQGLYDHHLILYLAGQTGCQ